MGGRMPRKFPRTIAGLDLSQIRQIVCAMEVASDRKEARKALAKRFRATPNVIDWCVANRTFARRSRSNWPFDDQEEKR